MNKLLADVKNAPAPEFAGYDGKWLRNLSTPARADLKEVVLEWIDEGSKVRRVLSTKVDLLRALRGEDKRFKSPAVITSKLSQSTFDRFVIRLEETKCQSQTK